MSPASGNAGLGERNLNFAALTDFYCFGDIFYNLSPQSASIALRDNLQNRRLSLAVRDNLRSIFISATYSKCLYL